MPDKKTSKHFLKIKLQKKLLRLSVRKIHPSPFNPRKHSKAQIHTICESYRRLGEINPIIVDEKYEILAGHGRYEAAKKLKLERISVLKIVGLNEEQKTAYRIADNKIALSSSWDDIKLNDNLKMLISKDFSTDCTGFTTGEIDVMLDDNCSKESQEIDELTEEDTISPIVSKRHDIWVFSNRHKLICGNARHKSTYKRLLGEERAQLVVTDPPYNVRIPGNVGGTGKIKHDNFFEASGEMSPEEFTNFLSISIKNISRYSKKNAAVFCFMDWRHMREIMDAAQPIYGLQKQLCVWVKNNGGMGTFYRSQHELAFIFVRPTQKVINNFGLGQNGRYRTNVWTYPGMNSSKGQQRKLLSLHPTIKPVAMIADILRDCSKKNGIVLDAFSGSGTILFAAERTGRIARAIEYEPKYVDITIQRWIRSVGTVPILEETGETFLEVMSRRGVSNEEQR